LGILDRFVAAGTSVQNGPNGAIKPQVRATKLRQNFHNERTGSTPLGTKLMFLGVSDRFITARKSLQNGLNWCNFDAQVCAMKSRCHDKRTRSTLLDPQLMFWGVLDRFITT
jgi:hypothetical protein